MTPPMTREELERKAVSVINRAVERGELHQLEIEGKMRVRDMGVNVRKLNLKQELMAAIDTYSDQARLDERRSLSFHRAYGMDYQATLEHLEEQNDQRIKALEAKLNKGDKKE